MVQMVDLGGKQARNFQQGTNMPREGELGASSNEALQQQGLRGRGSGGQFQDQKSTSVGGVHQLGNPTPFLWPNGPLLNTFHYFR